jgi:5-methylcytosine-specific restriction protein A
MGRRPGRFCFVPGCPRLAVARGYCQEHARQLERARGSAAARGYGGAWPEIQAEFLRAHPACVDCGAPAAEAHHLQPKRLGGTDDWVNLMALCKSCHSRRTAREHSRWTIRSK